LHFKSIQNKKVHPFNGTPPGGWGWTSFTGSVPDGDDTPGTILALLKLQPKEKVKKEILAACKWLNYLQNSDGGFPTFSKGWGKLPFDRSCSDLTGHCLLAISSVLETYSGELTEKEAKMLKKMFGKALNYIEVNQKNNGSWLPLWFGNQHTKEFLNPVYGTARVTTYLKDALTNSWHHLEIKSRINKLIENGTTFLLTVRNNDGSWGGNKNITGTIEETALAVSAIASEKHLQECYEALQWLDAFHAQNGMKAAPIGLYFALLWYDEQMYPVTAYLEALTRVTEITDRKPG
ncbi:MAG: terpene cyclase/mutase family protein, partial [Mariniphaga sp.]|nr:terpene cyclase/mutase family protein [Mariniphaga sp.]